MNRCLVRATNSLRRSSHSSFKKNHVHSLRFRQYTSISRNFRRSLSLSARNALNRNRSLLNNKISVTAPTASILFHRRHFAYNPNSTNPHRGNDSAHSGSIGTSFLQLVSLHNTSLYSTFRIQLRSQCHILALSLYSSQSPKFIQ